VRPTWPRGKIRQELQAVCQQGSSTERGGSSDGADSLVVGGRREGTWRSSCQRYRQLFEPASGERIAVRVCELRRCLACASSVTGAPSAWRLLRWRAQLQHRYPAPCEMSADFRWHTEVWTDSTHEDLKLLLLAAQSFTRCRCLTLPQFYNLQD